MRTTVCKMADMSLSDIFDDAFLLHSHIENSEGPTSSEEIQGKIIKAIDQLVCATEMVNSLGLFSSNEDLDEVPTTELRYLLLPALLGDLFVQQMSQDRLNQLKISKVYFIDFLKRCKNYGVTDLDVSGYTENSQARNSETLGFHHLLNSRQEKIARYKELRGQEEKLRELKSILDVRNPQDEENKRKYFKLLLKTWVNKAVDHLASIHSETNILEHMEKLRTDGGDTQRPEKSSVATMGVKTVLITRENVQKEVFGAGYSSVPTVSKDDFLKKEIEEGKVVLEYKYPQTSVGKQEEESDDDDDPGKLKKARDWDDWKDDHRRGWGNRDNMG